MIARQAMPSSVMHNDWHRLVGKGFSDLLAGLPFRVIQEMDLSARRSRLDFALIHLLLNEADADGRDPKGWRWPELPDGLTDLTEANLITYRAPGSSAKRATLWELIGYAVDYLKLEHKGDWDPLRAAAEEQPASEAEQEIDDKARQARELFIESKVAEEKVRLICVTTHRPEWLDPGSKPWQTAALPGIYELAGYELPIRLIVPRGVDKCPRNALWHVLSGDKELVHYGMLHFQAKDRALHSLFCRDVADCYSGQGIRLMAITSEDYRREARETLLAEATAEERLKGLDPEERLKGLDPEERLKGLDPEERLKGLDPEVVLRILLSQSAPEDAFRILLPNATDEQIQELMQQAGR